MAHSHGLLPHLSKDANIEGLYRLIVFVKNKKTRHNLGDSIYTRARLKALLSETKMDKKNKDKSEKRIPHQI